MVASVFVRNGHPVFSVFPVVQANHFSVKELDIMAFAGHMINNRIILKMLFTGSPHDAA